MKEETFFDSDDQLALLTEAHKSFFVSFHQCEDMSWEERKRDIENHETQQDLSRFQPLSDEPAGERRYLRKTKGGNSKSPNF